MQTYKLLESDHVHLVQPILVEKLGRVKAELLGQIHYWTKKEQGIFTNNKRWIFNTCKEWASQLKISERHMRRIMQDLMKDGLIFIEKLSNHKSNRTNYYALNYDAINSLFQPLDSKKTCESVDNSHVDKMSYPLGQNVPMVIHRITYKDKTYKSDVFHVKNFDSIEQVSDVNKNESEKEKDGHTHTKLNTTVQDMIKIWNEQFTKNQTNLSRKMAKSLMGAFVHKFDRDLNKWKHYCAKIASSSYLMGDKFILSLMWALKFSTIDRLLKGELGVKDVEFIPSTESLLKKAHEHIEGVGEGDRCKADRHLILNALGAATYVSWFTKVDFVEEEGCVQMKANNKFVEDYIVQKFGQYVSFERRGHENCFNWN